MQRTGWGKSLVYFIASRLLRDQGAGPTLLVSPLLSLMRNQIEAAERIGVRAARIDSENAKDWQDVEARLEANEIDVLLVSPERLANERFLTTTLPSIRLGIGLLVVDEAHCISDWGHDFRPDYRRIVRIAQGLPSTVPLLATTATANDRVTADVAAQLGAGLSVVRGPLTRDSLKLQAIRLTGQAERLAWLAEHLPQLPGSGIIYCLTVADCERVRRGCVRTAWTLLPITRSCPTVSRARCSNSGFFGTRSRRWWQPSPSGWDSTNPTLDLSCTSSVPGRSSPTTSKSAGPAARRPRPTPSF